MKKETASLALPAFAIGTVAMFFWSTIFGNIARFGQVTLYDFALNDAMMRAGGASGAVPSHVALIGVVMLSLIAGVICAALGATIRWNKQT